MVAEPAEGDAELDFSHVEPTAVLGRVMEDQAAEKTASFGGRKRLVECCRLVGIEVVQDNVNACGVRISHIGQPAHLLGKIVCGAPLGNNDMTPSGQWFEEQEEVARTVAAILVIEPGRPAWGNRLRRARFLDQLLVALIEQTTG